MMSLEVLELLKEKGLTIAFAESMTGGYATYELIKNPGASKVINESVVVYSIEAKEKYLGITKEDLKKHSIVSEYIALKMAKAIREKASSDIGVSITGNAGPTAQENSVNHTVCIGIVYNELETVLKYELYDMSREEVIYKCVDYIYDKLHDLLSL